MSSVVVEFNQCSSGTAASLPAVQAPPGRTVLTQPAPIHTQAYRDAALASLNTAPSPQLALPAVIANSPTARNAFRLGVTAATVGVLVGLAGLVGAGVIIGAIASGAAGFLPIHIIPTFFIGFAVAMPTAGLFDFGYKRAQAPQNAARLYEPRMTDAEVNSVIRAVRSRSQAAVDYAVTPTLYSKYTAGEAMMLLRSLAKKGVLSTLDGDKLSTAHAAFNAQITLHHVLYALKGNYEGHEHSIWGAVALLEAINEIDGFASLPESQRKSLESTLIKLNVKAPYIQRNASFLAEASQGLVRAVARRPL